MNKSQVKRAALLYRHAIVACIDCGDAESEEENAVMELAIEKATRELEKLGFNPGSCATIQECIAIAKDGIR